jgi:isoleucyl-tRNA synthetase
LSGFPDFSANWLDEAAARKWDRIVALKGEVSKALEICRQKQLIGHSLDAAVKLRLPEEMKDLSPMDRDQLKYVFIVSAVEIADRLEDERSYAGDALPGLRVLVGPAPGRKCERCWNYFAAPAERRDGAAICPRCIQNLEAARD